jgi:hypothetical protein
VTIPVGIAKPGVKSFSKIPLTLTNPPIIVEEYFDFIDVDILNTTADTNKVYIYIDNESLPFRLSDIAGTFVIGRKITITWDSSQNGLSLTLVLGKEYRYFTYRGWFALGRETIGLMSTLSGIKSQTDKLVFDSASNVKVDLANAEAILPVYVQLIDADETQAQSITLDTGVRSIVSVYAKADAPTTFHLDVSNDNINWFTDAIAYSNTTIVNDTIITGFRYIKLRSDASGVSGNKITLALSAKVG